MLCLFHDVIVTVGVVAVANLTGLVDARINLTMVAAFLTLVGLSINDTVVIYDRIRENRGKRPTITAAMIDLSVNQMLRTDVQDDRHHPARVRGPVRLQRRPAERARGLRVLPDRRLDRRHLLDDRDRRAAAPLPALDLGAGEGRPSRQQAGRRHGRRAGGWRSSCPSLLLALGRLGASSSALVAFVVGLVLFAPWALRKDVATEVAAA